MVLDDFKLEQEMSYKLLSNAIKNQKFSHAYIIETSSYTKSSDFIIAMVKMLMCPSNKVKPGDCGKCTQCSKIDNREHIDVEFVEPDGMWIKKNQLDNLQKNFKTKAIEGNKKVYIIKDANKMNASAANSILKFLEDPEDNIIAILTTENIYSLIDTIVSRCQILHLKNDTFHLQESDKSTIERLSLILFHDSQSQINFNCDLNKEKILKIIKFIKYFESNGLDTLLFVNKLWNEIIKEKEDYLQALSIVTYFYKDTINYILSNSIDIFVENLDDIIQVSKINSINSIQEKIKIVLEFEEKMKYNMNLNLLMDKLIIELGDVKHD